MFPPRRRGMRQNGLGLLLLLHQLYRVGFDRIPPVTLATVATNVLIYLGVLNSYIKSFIRSPAISNICVSTAKVWYKGDWPRLFLAAWFHLDEWHLYYNMASFLWKGIALERRFGSPYFAYIILTFAALTNAVLVGLNIALAEVFQDSSHVVSCAAGFSGVIFALKVLSTYYTPAHNQRIMGLFSVPSRWACWVELIVIQLIVPRASFTGHLAGILVGFAYVKGPLKIIMDAMWHLFSSVISGAGSGHGPRYDARRDTTGYRTNEGQSQTANSYGGRGYATGTSQSGARGGQSSASYATGGQASGRTYPRSEGTDSGMRGAGVGDAPSSPTLPSYRSEDFTGGLSEEEQIRAAMENSRTDGASNNSSYHDNRAAPSAPPYTEDEEVQRLYPDLAGEGGHAPPSSYTPNGAAGSGLSADELRRRRLAHLAR